jgi:predicted amidophosphoribosyltransferase
MPVYICSKCGRKVELPRRGIYICKVCGGRMRLHDIVQSNFKLHVKEQPLEISGKLEFKSMEEMWRQGYIA